MEDDIYYNPAYKGSKRFNQWDARTADATGFGAASDEYMERGIDLNEQLIHNNPTTYFMRVRGNAMTGAGIHDGDIVIVDRSLHPVSGKVVIAVLNGEMIIRRMEKTFNKLRLIPETPKLATIEIDAGCDNFQVWGVVTWVIHAP
jgi:DNA polymerase V